MDQTLHLPMGLPGTGQALSKIRHPHHEYFYVGHFIPILQIRK